MADDFWSKAAQTWPAKATLSALEALKLPGDVYAGRTDPMSDQGIGRATDLAGLVMGGTYAGAPAKQAGEAVLGAGPIKAYHGSPHDFDKFDLSKIGTGEGAQAYGHGLYFAEKEGVARSYRDTLARSEKQWFVDGELVGTYGQNSGSLGGAASRLRQVMGRDGVATEADAAAALKAFEQINKNSPGMIPKAHFEEVSRSIPQLVGRKVAESSPGRMYEVNINADPKQFLDWDKPLAEMGGEVQSKLGGFSPHMTGAQINESARLVPGSYRDNRVATQNLAERGIPGIKYLDGGSRGAGDGSSNYVMFDDKLIEIMRKYGLAGLAAPAAYGMTQEPSTP